MNVTFRQYDSGLSADGSVTGLRHGDQLVIETRSGDKVVTTTVVVNRGPSRIMQAARAAWKFAGHMLNAIGAAVCSVIGALGAFMNALYRAVMTVLGVLVAVLILLILMYQFVPPFARWMDTLVPDQQAQETTTPSSITITLPESEPTPFDIGSSDPVVVYEEPCWLPLCEASDLLGQVVGVKDEHTLVYDYMSLDYTARYVSTVFVAYPQHNIHMQLNGESADAMDYELSPMVGHRYIVRDVQSSNGFITGLTLEAYHQLP